MLTAERMTGIVAAICFVALLAFGEWSHRRGLARQGLPREQPEWSHTGILGALEGDEGNLDDARTLVFIRLHSLVSPILDRGIVCPSEGGPISSRVQGRLESLGLPVRGDGRCVLQGDDYVEADTGLRAARLMIFSVHSTSLREAVIEAGYSFGPLAGKGFSYTLRFEGNHWQIATEEFAWIS